MQHTKLFHLSHIDLDGYSCQLITDEVFKNRSFFNANYGPEVMTRLEEILELIDDRDDASLLLISDLNLTFKESSFLDEAVRNRRAEGKELTLLLLDHHASGKDSADAFEWYHLDTARCATKIVYDYALSHWNLSDAAKLWIEPYVNIVNAVDLWLMDEKENFEYGKVCMRLVVETRELNRYIFTDEDRNYKFSLLKQAAKMATIEDAPIILDESIHAMKKAFFRESVNNTLDGLATAFVVKLIGKYHSRFEINFRGYKGILTYALGNTSIIGNGILKAYPEYDFVVDVGSRGSMSLRADSKIDVSILSKELVGGGGHPNASGGRFTHFKEFFVYETFKKFFMQKLSEIEAKSAIPLKD